MAFELIWFHLQIASCKYYRVTACLRQLRQHN